MSIKIKADELAQTIAKELAEFEGATWTTVQNAVDKVAKESVTELHATAPKRKGGRGGAYARSWAHKLDSGKKASRVYTRIIYSKDPHYRLTHLLEKGRWKTQGGKGARPHIAKVEQKAIENVVRGIKDGIQ